MDIRQRHSGWQRQVWRFVTNPVTEVAVLVALVLAALVTLLAVETRAIHSPAVPAVFGPR